MIIIFITFSCPLLLIGRVHPQFIHIIAEQNKLNDRFFMKKNYWVPVCMDTLPWVARKVDVENPRVPVKIVPCAAASVLAYGPYARYFATRQFLGGNSDMP